MRSKNGPAYQDTAAYESSRRAYLQLGRAALVEHGPTLDRVLQAELLRPGSDSRCGVNIICRPSEELTTSIAAIKTRLRAYEPDQYYYPDSDLHLTLFEICHSRTPEQVAEIMFKLRPLLPRLFENVKSIRLGNPEFGSDAVACAAVFLPADDTLHSQRTVLAQVLTEFGIPINSRYVSQSAHVTIMRYVAPLRSGRQEWSDIVSRVPLDKSLTWSIRNVWVTWGPNWYGMRSHIHEIGPFSLL